MQRLLQLAFWAAVLVTLDLTLRPITMNAPVTDKTQHLLTFGMLTIGAALAYPRVRLPLLVTGLAGLGAAIEIVQPWFGRGRELLDWAADLGGILIGLCIILVWKGLQAKRRNLGL